MDTKEVFEFHSADLYSTWFSVITEMRKNRVLCDISIEVESRVFYAHRIVLASFCPYFLAVCQRNMIDCSMQEITIRDIDPLGLEYLLEYAYTSYLHVERDNVFSLMQAAKFLQVDNVLQLCLEFVKDEINRNSVFEIRAAAERLSIVDLLEHADRYIREHFDEVFSSEGFLSLAFPTVKEMLRSDDLNAKSEENVFECVMMWIKASEGDRELHLPDLLHQIRMPLLSPEYLVGRICTEELIRKSDPCGAIVDEAKNCHFSGKESLTSCSFITRERSCREKHHLKCALLMGFGMYSVYSNSKHRFSVNYFDPVNMQWAPLCCQTQKGFSRNVVTTEETIYFIGNKSIETLKLQTLEWSSIHVTPDLPDEAGVTLHCGKIYFLGGERTVAGYNCKMKKEVSAVDPQFPVLSAEGFIGTQRMQPCALSLKDDIYLFGGSNSQNGDLRSGEKYNTVTTDSTEISPMLTRRKDFRCAAMNDKIYVCGGVKIEYDPRQNSATRTCEAYDPVSNQWAVIRNLNREMSPKCLFSYADKLYIIDANSADKQYLYFETYDPDEDKWDSGESLASSEGFSTCNMVFYY